MKILTDYAMSFLGKPYIWGGNDPLAGFDCSGLCIELLQSVGYLPNNFDTTAQGLYNMLVEKQATPIIAAGALAFYGKDYKSISHVVFCLDQYRAIGANGGGSKTLTLQDAINQDAFIKIRPVKYRKDFVVALKPNYSCIGLI